MQTMLELISSSTKHQRGLDEICEKLLQRTKKSRRARILLHLLLAPSEPLTLGALQFALYFASTSPTIWEHAAAMWQNESDFHLTIANLCGLFINVVDEKVFLFHSTARDFLTTPPLRQSGPAATWHHSFQPAISHYIFEMACTAFYRFTPLDRLLGFDAKLNDGNSLAQYAAKNWLQHHALGSHTIHHFDVRDRAQVEDALSLLSLSATSTQPQMVDLAQAAFWAWYIRSGLSEHQLQFEWTSWLILLII